MKNKRDHDEQSGTSRSRGLLGLIPECTWGWELWEEMFIFFQHSEGWWPSADGEGEGRFLWERTGRRRRNSLFWGLSGEAQCDCVFMWENINAPLPMGQGAVPIIFSWETTCTKTERQKKREGEMKEDQILPFCSHWFFRVRLCVAAVC